MGGNTTMGLGLLTLGPTQWLDAARCLYVVLYSGPETINITVFCVVMLGYSQGWGEMGLDYHFNLVHILHAPE